MLNDILYLEYSDGDENDRRKIIEAITNHQPSQNLIRSIVKKYNEVIYDFESREPMPVRACPMCGCAQIKKYEQLDYHRDEMYYFAECTECEWSDWTQ